MYILKQNIADLNNTSQQFSTANSKNFAIHLFDYKEFVNNSTLSSLNSLEYFRYKTKETADVLGRRTKKCSQYAEFITEVFLRIKIQRAL